MIGSGGDDLDVGQRGTFVVILREGSNFPEPVFGGVEEEHVGGFGGSLAAGGGDDLIHAALRDRGPVVVEAEAEQTEEKSGDEQRQGDAYHAAAGLDHGDDFPAAGEFSQRIE